MGLRCIIILELVSRLEDRSSDGQKAQTDPGTPLRENLGSVGLEAGYSFGHSLDATRRFSGQALQSVKEKVVQVTPSVLLGPWIRTRWLPLRPYAALGAGYYNLNIQSRFLFNGLPAVASDSHNAAGFNLGGGVLFRWNESFATGLDLRYHQAFVSQNDFHYLAATLRFACLF